MLGGIDQRERTRGVGGFEAGDGQLRSARQDQRCRRRLGAALARGFGEMTRAELVDRGGRGRASSGKQQ